MSLVVESDNDCVFGSVKIVMKKNIKKVIDWGCSKKHKLFCSNCSKYSYIYHYMFVRGAMSKNLQKSNLQCVEVDDVSVSSEIIKVLEKCHC